MDLFIEIHDRFKDLDMELSMAVVETYKELNVIDPDGTEHLCILYLLRNGLRFEEEFDNESDRQAKLADLDEYKV